MNDRPLRMRRIPQLQNCDTAKRDFVPLADAIELLRGKRRRAYLTEKVTEAISVPPPPVS